MPSSVVASYAYQPDARRLAIRFVSGELYVYDDVPPAVAAGLKGATSKGRFFQRHIRDRFAYRRERGLGTGFHSV